MSTRSWRRWRNLAVGSSSSARNRPGADWAPLPRHASDSGTWISRAEVLKRLDHVGRGAPVNLHSAVDLAPWIHAPPPRPMAPTRAVPGTNVAPSASYSCDASRRRPLPRAPRISRPRAGSASTCAAATTCWRRMGSSSWDSGRPGHHRRPRLSETLRQHAGVARQAPPFPQRRQRLAASGWVQRSLGSQLRGSRSLPARKLRQQRRRAACNNDG